eukprot:1697133-Amphidinium_carterae.1
MAALALQLMRPLWLEQFGRPGTQNEQYLRITLLSEAASEGAVETKSSLPKAAQLSSCRSPKAMVTNPETRRSRVECGTPGTHES